MNKPLPGEDETPWFKQFWPWFLILLPTSVVIAGLTTVFIAHEGADDLVADEYYKDGLAINRKLEKKQHAAELGIDAALSINGSDIVVRTVGPVGVEKLKLLMSHPLESNQDFEVYLIQSTPGVYRGRLATDIAPRWHWALMLPGDEGWRLDGSITESDFNTPGGG